MRLGRQLSKGKDFSPTVRHCAKQQRTGAMRRAWKKDGELAPRRGYSGWAD